MSQSLQTTIATSPRVSVVTPSQVSGKLAAVAGSPLQGGGVSTSRRAMGRFAPPVPTVVRDSSTPPRDIRSFSSRERILAAALKLFVERGYFNTNIPDLSRESRCSVGSIYHTFKNKEEVATALYHEGMSAFRSALLESLRGTEDVATLVRCIVRSFLHFSEVNQQLSRYLWLCRHSEFMSGHIKHPTVLGFDELGRLLTKALKTAIREKKIKEMNAHTIWSLMFGIPLAYVRDWLDGYNPLPPSAVADELAEAAWRAISA